MTADVLAIIFLSITAIFLAAFITAMGAISIQGGLWENPPRPNSALTRTLPTAPDFIGAQMMATLPKTTGTRGQLQGKDAEGKPVSGGVPETPPEDATATLPELGIDKNLAKRAWRLQRYVGTVSIRTSPVSPEIRIRPLFPF
jgi:hypothetical protein